MSKSFALVLQESLTATIHPVKMNSAYFVHGPWQIGFVVALRRESSSEYGLVKCRFSVTRVHLDLF